MVAIVYVLYLVDTVELVTLSDVKDISDPLNKVEAGLKTDGGMVPLQSVHIRAQLIDLAAKVLLKN